MRVTFVLPGIGLSGGVLCTFELANRLQDRGHEVSVVYPMIRTWSRTKWWSCRQLAGSLVTFAKHPVPTRPDWCDLRANLIRVPTLAERWIPDGDIVVATLWATAYYVNEYSRSKGEKFYFIRAYETWCGPVAMVERTYSLELHKIVNSNWLKGLVERKSGCSVSGPVADAVNSSQFYREASSGECHSPKRVGIMYRRGEWKGMQDGLTAFMRARREYPNVQIVLFGDPPTSDDMRIVESVNNIEFHARPFGERLRRVYNSLDIFVFPSRSEGFGDPPMEAMACGVAVVTTNVGGVPDYTLPGETALVSPPQDPEALGENIVKLLRDEEERKRIARGGYNHIQRFTWDRTADALENIFLEASKRA